MHTLQEKTTFLFKKIEDKTIVWIANSNQYLTLENKTAEILQDLIQHKSIQRISEKLALALSIPTDKAKDFVLAVDKELYKPNKEITEKSANENNHFEKPTVFQYSKKYLINNFIFLVDYQSEEDLYFVHPKFAHLEINHSQEPDFHYHVFIQNNYTFLLVNETLIGSWHRKEIHYFQGKFSMQLVQDIHKKEEEKWLGVFHASAVSDGKNSMLFLGDSGNGKSTSLALLQANGFTCLADDFVPVDAKKQQVYSFPSAISIKKNSLKTLLPFYPELENSAEYHFKRLNKIVRYLPPNNKDYTTYLPCKALIFIKYIADSDLEINKISNIIAFEKLVPDSWLSTEIENAKTFLDWFSNLPCYEITYSNNEKMIDTVSKIFKDEL